MRQLPPTVFVNWPSETLADACTYQFLLPRGAIQGLCHQTRARWFKTKKTTRPLHALPSTMVAYCEPCGCRLSSDSPDLLAQHNQGRRHLQNVAAIRIRNPVTPDLPPPRPVTFDPRAVVSHGGGLDFVVEGTEVAGQPSFFPVEQTIFMEVTQVTSSLSVPFLRLVRPTNTPASWCGLFDDSI